ncbi:MAG: hypothetical protein WB973_13060 [Thermoanaerobaculia bacterium]
MTGVSLERARTAKTKIADLLQDETEVCGIGIATLDGGYGVKVNVTAAARLNIPDEVDGVPVVVMVVGEILRLREK